VTHIPNDFIVVQVESGKALVSVPPNPGPRCPPLAAIVCRCFSESDGQFAAVDESTNRAMVGMGDFTQMHIKYSLALVY